MIARGLPLRCVALTPETQFDTHATQAATLTPGVTLAGEAIAAFQADLEARGIADRVLIHVWSEFRAPRAGERLARHRPRSRPASRC